MDVEDENDSSFPTTLSISREIRGYMEGAGGTTAALGAWGGAGGGFDNRLPCVVSPILTHSVRITGMHAAMMVTAISAAVRMMSCELSTGDRINVSAWPMSRYK